MFKRKKKTGCETPKFSKPTVPPQPSVPPMPPVKPAKENAIDTSHLRIKTLEAIRIEVNKNHLTAFVEVAELQDAAKVQVSTNSSIREDCNYKGDLFNLESLSWRDAFAPGATMYLVGIFEDWVTGELIYGEYDVLNYTFTRKENNK